MRIRDSLGPVFEDAQFADLFAARGHPALPPSQLARFLNQYFEAVFPPITEREGAVIDLIGDAVLALWTGDDGESSLHLKASGAALELMSAVDRFNAASPTLRLPTRIGLSGWRS